MTNRFLLKQFAENGDKGVFGSYQAGNKTVSSDPATLQSLTAWTNGWADAISNGSHLPAMEEFQAVQYLICKAVKELYSEGIPVWMAGETYYKGAICSYIDSEGNVALYKNITGNNGVQQPALDIINWATFSAGGGGASAGGQMFDVVQKDHSLTFDESKGYVPLGGYAYKEGVSGSRYGYPTFYETCVSEYQAGVAEQMTIGSDTITVKRNSNGHVYYDIADKSIVDTLYADTGIAWMYGIDTTSERIALPRNDYMARGEKGIVGNGIALGLTDGTNNLGFLGSTADDQRRGSNAQPNAYGVAVGTALAYQNTTPLNHATGVTTDPTKSGIELVKAGADKYLYMICGTTEEEVAMTEVTEVTTSENDTIPLFTHKYFEFKPNHISWVPANTIQDGTVYTSAYNTLVGCLTSNPYEIKVIDEADEQVGVDYSEYWIVNQTNETFRTPAICGERVLIAKKEPTDTDTTWCNLYSDGWCEQGGIVITPNSGYMDIQFLREYIDLNYSISLNAYQADGSFTNWYAGTSYESTTGMRVAGQTAVSGEYVGWKTAGYTSIPTISDYTELVRLYFKVDNAVQNLELIDVGELAESKANINASNFNQTGKSYLAGIGMPSDRADTLTVLVSGSQYTAPANGWFDAGSTTGNCWLRNQNSGLSIHSSPTSGFHGGHCYIVARRGDKVVFEYSGSGLNLSFIYAEGEKNV